jgi:hypothetical protein
MIPGKAFVLAAGFPALARAMRTIGCCERNSPVKCRGPQLLLKAAIDDSGGMPLYAIETGTHRGTPITPYMPSMGQYLTESSAALACDSH